MREFLNQTEVRWLLMTTVLVMLIAVGYYLVNKVRRGMYESEPGANELLTDFRRLHDQGELSEEEYRNIKQKLRGKLLAPNIAQAQSTVETNREIMPGIGGMPPMRVEHPTEPNMDGGPPAADGKSDESVSQ